MSPLLHIHRRRAYAHKHQNSDGAESTPSFVTFGVIGALLVVICLYVWQVNMIATKGFVIKDLENRTLVLQRENQRLELSVASLQSTKNIEYYIEQLGMVNEGKTEYLTVQDHRVAKR